MEKWLRTGRTGSRAEASNYGHGERKACSYVELRNDILAAFRRAQPVLNEVKAILGVGDFELPTRELENEKFILALMGAFQSGKSTLFSYLCGGLELSKVGAGLRTTGCCVTATALPEGESDYAEITWFDEDEIKTAISDYTGKRVNEIRIRDRTWCRKFEKELLARSRVTAQSVEQKQDETLSVLLMLHFFYVYEGMCEKREKIRFYDVGVPVAYSCYPDRWEQRWQEVKAVSDIDHYFKLEDAAFAFCKRIDYYIDSPTLRTLGCTIQDCPGMFASNRDSALTRRIIQKSNAILYTISGDNGLSDAEKECIRECRMLSTSDKIIFGANLHGSFRRWEKTIKPEVISQLKELGIGDPKMFHYHAPLALHCRELYRLLHGKLHQVSEKAIQACIDASKSKSDTPEKYLRKRINFWIGRLDEGEGDCIENYCYGNDIRWQKLSELHRGVELINFLKTGKNRILLQGCGIDAAQKLVDQVYVHLGEVIRKLDSENRAKESSMKDFRSTQESIEQVLENKLTTSLTEFDTVIAAELGKIEKEIIAQIGDYDSAWWLYKESEKDALVDFLKKKVERILSNIKYAYFPGVYSFFVKNAQRILNKNAEKLCEFANQPLTGIEIRHLRFNEYDRPAITQCSMPMSSFRTIDCILDRYKKSTFDVITFGIFLDSDEVSRVRSMWKELKPQVFALMRQYLKQMLLSYVVDPMEKIVPLAKKLDGLLCDTYTWDMKSLQGTFNKNDAKIRDCKRLQNQIDNVRREFNKIANQVKEFIHKEENLC